MPAQNRVARTADVAVIVSASRASNRNTMMPLFVMPFPAIDPVALNLGPISIKWYGLAYMAGLLLGWLYIRQLLARTRLWRENKPPMQPLQTDDLLIWTALGVVIGGRLGYVLFYKPVFFAQHPFEIFMPWKGGMAFHGGLIGTTLAIWWVARGAKANPLSLMDLVAAAAPIGLFFGRIANFINAELWGRAATVPWAMVFPDREAGGVARHPSQLYESFFEGFVLFLIIRVLIYRHNALATPGRVTGIFLIGYALARMFCEAFRENMHPEISIGPITAGQLYSIPMVLLGLVFLNWAWISNRFDRASRA